MLGALAFLYKPRVLVSRVQYFRMGSMHIQPFTRHSNPSEGRQPWLWGSAKTKPQHKLLSGETIQGNTIDLLVRALSVGQPHRAAPITVALATAAAANLKGSTVHANVSGEKVGSDVSTIGHSVVR